MEENTKPLPRVNQDNREFWRGCKQHELRFQQCKDCGHVRWPASMVCPECLSRSTQWIVSSGKGKVYTFAVYHVAFHPGFKDELPYVVADVELNEGPRLVTQIVDCPHDQIVCDMPMVVKWDDITEEFSLPKFRPIA
ncbi:MAG: Zn-ribbon domain-containing OB-fold protein [Thermodesulfobacteriota bacterium]